MIEEGIKVENLLNPDILKFAQKAKMVEIKVNYETDSIDVINTEDSSILRFDHSATKVYIKDGETKTIEGIPPLSFDALEDLVVSLIQYGKCEQNGTPSPNNPVDIKCNNGTIVLKDAELPIGYKRLEKIDFNSNAYYDTEEKLYGSDVVTMTIDNVSTSGQNLFGCYSGTGESAWNFSMYIYGTTSGQSYWRYGQTLYRPTLGGTTEKTISFGAGGTDGFKTDVSYESEEFTTTSDAYIGALPNSSSTKFSGGIVGNITVGSRLKYIPCERVSDGAIGYYETKKGVFLEPNGTAPTKGNYDLTHLTIYVNGTPEVITLETQTANAENLFGVGDYVDEQDIISGEITRRTGIVVFNGTETVNVSGDGYSISISDKLKSKVKVLCTHYPYSSATMTNAPDKSIIAFASQNIGFKDSSFTSTSDVQTFLATQYANGTPVIVVYPLAEETTETVEGQELTTIEGTNTMSVTAEIDDIEFKIEYIGEKE